MAREQPTSYGYWPPPYRSQRGGVYRSQRGGIPLESGAEVYPLEVNPLEVKHTSSALEPKPIQKILSVSASATPDAQSSKKISKSKTPQKNLTQEQCLELVSVWNTHCGNLPRVDKLNDSRETALNELFREYELDSALTGSALEAAVRCVAVDSFWLERKYGLTNLLRKGAVTTKAEMWRSSQPKTVVASLANSDSTAQTGSFEVGSWVRLPSGTVAQITAVSSKGLITTAGDIPLGKLRTLEHCEPSEALRGATSNHGADV